jgi:membrane protein DedA with SNARE-associated domain
MRVPAAGAIAVIAVASTIWYTTLALIAYRLGTQWDRIMGAIKDFQTVAAIVAGAIVALGLLAWWVARRRIRT